MNIFSKKNVAMQNFLLQCTKIIPIYVTRSQNQLVKQWLSDLQILQVVSNWRFKMATAKTRSRSGAKTASKPRKTVTKVAATKTGTAKETQESTLMQNNEAVSKSEIQPSQNVVANTTTKPTSAKVSNDQLDFATTMELFKMNNFEIPFTIREIAEKNVEQARETYEKVKSATEAATEALQESTESSRKQVVKFNEKVIDSAKVNTSATFEFYKDVVAVNSLSEVFELQSEFAQKQFANASKQGKELQGLVSKFATEVTAPAKKAFENAFGAVATN